MRVISQNQKYDVPYEQTAFISEGIMIYGFGMANSGCLRSIQRQIVC